MGLFNNSKKIIDTNDTMKKNIINTIASAATMCNDAKVVAGLNDIRAELQSHGQSDDKEVIKLDAQLNMLITQISQCIAKQQFSSAISLITKAKGIAVERRGHCLLGGTKTKAEMKEEAKAKKQQEKMLKGMEDVFEKTRLEELQEKQNAAQDELNKKQKELQDLYVRAQKNPNDYSIITQAQVVSDTIESLKGKISKLNAEIQRERVTTQIHTDVVENNNIIEGRTISDEQYQTDIEDLNNQNIQTAETMSNIEAGRQALKQGSNTYTNNPFANMNTNANPFANMNAGTTNNPFANMETNANPFANMNTGANANPFATNTQAQANSPFGNVGSREMANDIQKTLREIEKGEERFNDMLDDCNDELKDLDMELIPLLKKRKTANASECLVLDGQIDQLNAKRNNIQHKIKRTRSALAKLTEQRSLIEKLSVQQDIAQTNAQINSITNGKFANLDDLAMYLRSEIEKSNEELEEVGTYNVVVDDAEININRLSGNSEVQVEGEVKDEERYAALEAELGMTETN